ncbi:MAG TPA: hypothetical protein VKE40_27345 [Gemmataceae bacterium]|nr:hypothetical protein [Gemmataceae bacterium]
MSTRDWDEEDDRPRRRSREWDEDDADDPGLGPPGGGRRRSGAPGQSLGVASFMCGLSGLLIALLSGGPFLCGMCCFAFLPISWVISIIGALLGGTGVTLGFVSRSQGNPSVLPVLGVASGVFAILLAIAAIVLPFVLAANLPPPPPNPPGGNPNFNNLKRF